VDCIRSIINETQTASFEVVVFDNASSDDSVSAVREKFPHIRVVASLNNVGFPEANNRSIPLTSGKYLLLLNADTVILDRALDEMVRFLDNNTEVGVVGPKMYDAAMRPWRYETWYLTPIKYLLNPLLLRWRGDIGNRDVDWVCGACLMIRREVFEQIGLLDCFMFGEDTDWCYRAKKAGWRIYHLGRAKIIHYWGASATAPDRVAWRVFVTRQSKLYYARKHFGRHEYVLFAISIGIEALIKLPILMGQKLLGSPGTRQRREGQIEGYRRLIGTMITGRILSNGNG